MNYIPAPPPGLFTKEIFGYPTDFLIEQVWDSKTQQLTVKVSTVMPALRPDANGLIAAFPPPRYPWPNVKEPHA